MDFIFFKQYNAGAVLFLKHIAMNYKKLMAKTFDQRSDNRPQMVFALIAGLAAGAVVAVLFATKSGKNMRRQITDKIAGLGQDARDIYASMICKNAQSRASLTNGAEEDQVNHYVHQAATKKPKSDIKELIHDAHAGAAHTEQNV